MSNRLTLWISDMSCVSALEPFGRVTFVDDYSNTVFMEVDSEDVLIELRSLTFVQSVNYTRVGALL